MAGQTADWYLVSNFGTNIALPQTMISLGREACDVILQSKSVDKRHAVITYDHYEKRFKVKDLNSINGTYLNNARIPSHTFVKVEQLDWLRFGFVVYQVQVLERFPTTTSTTTGVEYRRIVGWPTATQAVFVHRPHLQAPPPVTRMTDCHGCQQKHNIRHTCEMKNHEWDHSNHLRQPPPSQSAQPPQEVTVAATVQGPIGQQQPQQDYCGNIMTSHVAPVPIIASSPVSSSSSSSSSSASASCPARSDQPLNIGYGEHNTCPESPQTVCRSSNPSAPLTLATQDALSPLGTARIYKSPETSSNSLKSFSGDSLDLLCEAGGSSSLAKKQPAGSTSHVVKAEKPYVTDPPTAASPPHQPSSSAEVRSEPNPSDMRAPSFCPPSNSSESLKDSSAFLRDGGGAAAAERVLPSVRPPSCTAFTIEFDGDGSAATKKLDIKDSIRKFAPPKIESDVSKVNGSAGHRRNLSLSKVEEIKVVECFSDENGNTDEKSSELSPQAAENKKRAGDATSGGLMSDSPGVHPMANSARHRLVGGHHIGYTSEGHFSSDQDDDLRDPVRNTSSAKSAYSGASKLTGEPERPPRRAVQSAGGIGNHQNRHSLPAGSGDLKDSARYLINRMFGDTPAAAPSHPSIAETNPSKLMIKSDSAVVCVRDHENVTPLPLSKNDQKTGSHSSLISTATYVVQGGDAPGAKSRAPFKTERLEEVVQELNSSSEDDQPDNGAENDEDVDDDGEEDDDDDDEEILANDGEDERIRDDVSESGTYTIEKDAEDVDPTDEVEARKNIDKVFGVESAAASSVKVVNNHDDGDANIFEGVVLRIKSPAASESEAKTKNDRSSRKTTPRWLKEWVAQSAGQLCSISPSPEIPPTETSKTVTKGGSSFSLHSNRSVATPSNTAVNNCDVLPPQRPRRKLPVLPVDEKASSLKSSNSSSSRPTTAKSAPPASAERLRAHSISPDGIRSDSSMDTEMILKDTENVVAAMETRMLIDSRRGESNNNQKKKNLPAIALISSSIESRDSGGESDLDTSAASPVQDRNFRLGGTHTPTGIYKKLSAQLKAQLRGLDATGTARGQNRISSRGDCSVDNVSEVETASIHSDVSTSSDLSGSSPGSKRKADGSPVMRFNRAFSLRRARLGCESDGGGGGTASGNGSARPTANSKRLSTPTSSSRPSSAGSSSANKDRTERRAASSNKSDGASAPGSAASSSKSSSFARNDGGRFSLRLPRSAPLPSRTQPTLPAKVSTVPSQQPKALMVPKPPSKGGGGGGQKVNARCNSTLTSKELELKNWRRRKEYDPLKAAAEGRKKEAAARKGPTTMVGPAVNVSVVSKSETGSPTGISFQRSASFHGTDGIEVQNRRDTFNFEDDDYDDDHEETPGSLELNGRKSLALDKLVTTAFENSDAVYRSRNKKNSEDDSASEATRTLSHTELVSDDMNTSPRGSPIMHAVMRHKSKTDALDNLVISTIHQMSSNLRGTTVNILKKVADLHAPECEQVFGKSGVQESLAKLSSTESPVSTPQGRTVSKQLAATLKNVKRLEDSLQIIERVLQLVPALSLEGNGHDNVNGSAREKKSPSRTKHNKWNGFQDGNYY